MMPFAFERPASCHAEIDNVAPADRWWLASVLRCPSYASTFFRARVSIVRNFRVTVCWSHESCRDGGSWTAFQRSPVVLAWFVGESFN